MSTMSEEADQLSSKSEQSDDVNQSSNNKFEFTWHDLSFVNSHINDKGWSRRPIPADIETLPQNVVISDTIRQILQWSIQRLEDFDEGNTAGDSDQKQLNSNSERTDSSREPRSDGASTLTENATSNSNEVETSSSSSSINFGRSGPLISRLKQIRQDMATRIALKTQNKAVITPVTSSDVVEVKPQKGECISCYDEFAKYDLIRAKCSHDYCKPCLREVVLNAMKTETAFPPKCCLTEIPLKLVLVCLEKEERDKYREKSAEYSIPAGHRWYCPEPKCTRWIKPEKLHQNRRDLQTCPHCKARICSICRSLAHEGNQECPQDFGLEATLEVAQAEGWQRCYSCRTMVELTTGCRHMTCRCGAQFCYVCCAKWRTCSCSEADKERKLQEIRARREQRDQLQREEEEQRREEDEAALAEAEELAEAIRQVEEMERQDAIRRVEEERQRQLEEELALARLEEARLIEEIARREAEEEAERQFRQVLLDSSKEECQAMMKTLMQIITFQHTAMMSNHLALEQSGVHEDATLQTRLNEEHEEMTTWLEENIARRTDMLSKKQQKQWEKLLRQLEDAEDEMFMQISNFLKDKPNRQRREKNLQESFQKEQLEKQTRLQNKHDKERQRLELGAFFEREGLRKAAEVKLVPLTTTVESTLRQVGHQIGCERRWFQVVCARRLEMMKEHRRLVLEQLEAEQEPIGLTEAQARLIEPQLPATDNEDTDVEDEIQNAALHESADPEPTPNALLPERPISGISSGSQPLPDSPVSAMNDTNSHALAAAQAAFANTSQLSRSDTVIRHVPGAFPTTSDSQNRKTFPQATPRVSRRPVQRSMTNNHMDSVSPVLNSSKVSPPTISVQTDLSHPSNNAATTFAAIPSPSAQRPNPTAESPNTLSLTSSTSTTTTSASASASTRTSYTSLEPDTDLLDSICASKIGRATSEAAVRKPPTTGTRRFFSGFRKSGREMLSEEEIKRRMSLCVGDGLGV